MRNTYYLLYAPTVLIELTYSLIYIGSQNRY